MQPNYATILQERAQQGLLRQLNPLQILPEGKVALDEHILLNFVSNNYLDLSHHPEVIAAMQHALGEFGAGSTGSRLLGGDVEIFHRCEDFLAAHYGVERAVLYATGYMANVGFISAVCAGQNLFCDRLIHASVLDGARLGGAKLHRFKHNDPADLERLLQQHPEPGWIAVESLYSMDGDFAPLQKMVELAEQYGHKIVVDEAHAEGIYGPQGKGWVQEWGLQNRVTAVIATFGKAYGVAGAAVLTSEELAQWLHNHSRAFIYSTAPSPTVAAGIMAALAVAQRENWRSKNVIQRSGWLREYLRDAGFDILQSQSQIIPVVLGENERALRAAAFLRQQGIWAAAIREPSVPKGTARLRLNVCAGHSQAHLEMLGRALVDFRNQAGF